MKKRQKKPIEITVKQANVADVIWYMSHLLRMKDAMYNDYRINLEKFYKINENYFVADADPFEELQELIDKIGEKWFSVFHKNSFKLARRVVLNAKKSVDRKFNDIYKKHLDRLNPPSRSIFENEIPETFEQINVDPNIVSQSPSILKQPFTSFYEHPIPDFNKSYAKNPFIIPVNLEERNVKLRIIQSSIAENVGLIKSIPRQFHEQIQGMVMRNVAVGGNAQKLVSELSKISDRSSKRIKLIANDQIAKATALLDQHESVELGFTKAKWKKSIAGKTHRKTHAEANNKIFDIKKGCLIEGEYIMPRVKINCKCSYKLILE